MEPDIAREVDRVGAHSRIVEATTILVGVIGVGRGVCLRLSDVLGEVSVPVTRSTSAAPKASGTGSSFWTSLEKALPVKLNLQVSPPFASPQTIMISSSPKILHPVDAKLVNLGTVKSRRKAWDVDNFVLLLRLCGAGSNCGERAKASQRQKRRQPAMTNRPIKTRRLKKADREADFFFMEWVMMWMDGI